MQSGETFELTLTFHGEDTTAEVFEVDPPMRVGVQTFCQLPHLWRSTERPWGLSEHISALFMHTEQNHEWVILFPVALKNTSCRSINVLWKTGYYYYECLCYCNIIHTMETEIYCTKKLFLFLLQYQGSRDRFWSHMHSKIEEEEECTSFVKKLKCIIGRT